MTSMLFLGFVVMMAAMVLAIIARYLDRRTATRASLALAAWFLYAGLMGYFGVFRNAAMRPPGMLFLLVPVLVLLLVFFVRPSISARFPQSVPLWILLGLQSFRIGVELFLHQLWHEGLVPRMLTFAGANVDIYIGASAPLIAWLSTRGRTGTRIALVWNGIGLLALANVVVRAILTAPGPMNLLHAEIPNRMIGVFPYLFIPAFFVPLAFVLHILAIRKILASTR